MPLAAIVVFEIIRVSLACSQKGVTSAYRLLLSEKDALRETFQLHRPNVTSENQAFPRTRTSGPLRFEAPSCAGNKYQTGRNINFETSKV